MALCANGGKERLTTTSSKPVAPNLRGNKLPAVRHPRLEGPISHTPDRGERERERREKASKEAGSIFPDLEYTEADNIGVGLGYQERTPLLVGRNDSAEVRDARSYAAEAARCMCNVSTCLSLPRIALVSRAA